MFKSIRRTIVATATALSLGIGGAVWATSAASAAPDATPACSTANLSVWVDVSQGSGAAGTISYPLDFTNTGSRACTLYGYPGVSATNANGGQIGRAAGRNPLYKAKTVTIPAGGSAHAVPLLGRGRELHRRRAASRPPRACSRSTRRTARPPRSGSSACRAAGPPSRCTPTCT